MRHESYDRPMTAQRIAIVDLGSNTARLVVINAVPGQSWRVEDEIREVVRLRQGMSDERLADAAMQRAFVTLRLFKRFCDAVRTDHIVATATSAVRDAANGRQFVERVQRELGLELRILDGEREAYYGVIGALNDAAVTDGAVVDIGGGSAEVSQVADRRYVQGWSAPLGALALTERFIRHDPPTAGELSAVRAEIDRHLDKVKWLPGLKGQLVGLGGTIRNLARIEAQRRAYPLPTLHGFELTRASVAETIDLLSAVPLGKRLKVPGLRSDRADIILPGAMVIHAVQERMGAPALTVSVNGLREGLFFEHFWGHWAEPISADIRGFGVLNLARIYQYQKTHANHVRFLAGRIFDQLAPLHGYGLPERESWAWSAPPRHRDDHQLRRPRPALADPHHQRRSARLHPAGDRTDRAPDSLPPQGDARSRSIPGVAGGPRRLAADAAGGHSAPGGIPGAWAQLCRRRRGRELEWTSEGQGRELPAADAHRRPLSRR